MGYLAAVCWILLWPAIGNAENGLSIRNGKESGGIEKLAMETAKKVGFELAVSSLPKQEHIAYIGGQEVSLTAKCFSYNTEFPFVSCQVYAGKTGKILNLECQEDECMVTGVLDIHR
jgi:hypothetical protein